jgi:hypothetical protein
MDASEVDRRRREVEIGMPSIYTHSLEIVNTVHSTISVSGDRGGLLNTIILGLI